MIQGIINRMASNSFFLKGWTITLLVGLFVLSEKNAHFSFYFIAFIPIILFWFLDSYYLQLERKYRVLYHQATELPMKKIMFKLLPPKSNRREKTCFYQSLLSITEYGFYVPMSLLVILIMIFTSHGISMYL